jgi:CARDB
VSDRGTTRTVGVVVLAALLVVPAATAHAAKKKPDLVVAAGKVEGDEYAFIGERFNVTATWATKNKGSGRAGRSLTRATFYHQPGGHIYRLGAQAVGRLGSDGVDEIDDERPLNPNRLPAGGYAIRICADAKEDVNESNEGNNCGRVQAKFSDFYSTYREWEGTVSGIGWGLGGPTFSGMTESWTSRGTGADVAYTFTRYRSSGKFVWGMAGGAIKWTHQGSLGPGCSNVNGSGTFVLDPGSRVAANYGRESYSAQAVAISGAQYPITSDCGFGGTGPVHPTALSTGMQRLPFDTGSLAGVAASEVDPGVNYSWDLAGG